MWGLKTDVLETALSDHFGHILQLDQVSLSENKPKQNKAICECIRVTNEENIKYLNYLLSCYDWKSVCQQTTIDTAYTRIPKNPSLLFSYSNAC